MRPDRIAGVGLSRGLRVQVLLMFGMACSLATAAPSPLRCHVTGEPLLLRGKVIHEVHAGPPNYQSIRRGDAREVQFFLLLPDVLCVIDAMALPAPASSSSGRQLVSKLQLIDLRGRLSPKTLAKCQQACSLKGRLMEAESGHHHTRMLFELE